MALKIDEEFERKLTCAFKYYKEFGKFSQVEK